MAGQHEPDRSVEWLHRDPEPGQHTDQQAAPHRDTEATRERSEQQQVGQDEREHEMLFESEPVPGQRQLHERDTQERLHPERRAVRAEDLAEEAPAQDEGEKHSGEADGVVRHDRAQTRETAECYRRHRDAHDQRRMDLHHVTVQGFTTEHLLRHPERPADVVMHGDRTQRRPRRRHEQSDRRDEQGPAPTRYRIDLHPPHGRPPAGRT